MLHYSVDASTKSPTWYEWKHFYRATALVTSYCLQHGKLLIVIYEDSVIITMSLHYHHFRVPATNFTAHGLDCGDEAAEWISNFLGKPYRIMKFSDSLPERKQNRDIPLPEWSKLLESETVSVRDEIAHVRIDLLWHDFIEDFVDRFRSHSWHSETQDRKLPCCFRIISSGCSGYQNCVFSWHIKTCLQWWCVVKSLWMICVPAWPLPLPCRISVPILSVGERRPMTRYSYLEKWGLNKRTNYVQYKKK